MEHQKLTLTINETTALLGIGRQLAYAKAKTGEIPTIRLNSRLLVPKAALEKMLADPKTAEPN